MALKVSQSSVKKFRRCKRHYYYAVVQGLEPRLLDVKLRLGGWFHKLMEAHYKGEDWHDAHARELKKFRKLFKEERDHYGDLPKQVVRMMESYLWHYRKVEADWEVLYVEETFTAFFESEGDEFTFKPDLIVRDHSTPERNIWVVDHKTVKSMPPGEWRIEDLQSTLYPWALREGMDLDIKGFIFNYIRKKAPSIPKINKNGAISRARIDTDYPTMARFLLDYYDKSNVNDLPVNEKTKLLGLKGRTNFFKRTKLDKEEAITERQIEEFQITAQEMEVWHEIEDDPDDDQDPWVRTMIPACSWDCDFYDLCILELMGQDSKFMKRAKFQPSKYMKERDLG